MTEPNRNTHQRKTFSRGGPREAFIVLFLLVLLSSLVGPVVKPVFFLATVIALFYYLLKTAFSFGKPLGWTTITVLCVTAAGFGSIQYAAKLKHEALLARLEEFDEVSIQRESIFPASPVIQISATNKIDDHDLRTLADIPELVTITHFYLKDTKVSEEGLEEIDRFPNLEYLLIETSRISNEAIYQFGLKRPHLRIINSDG